jgi:hypothetical protein
VRTSSREYHLARSQLLVEIVGVLIASTALVVALARPAVYEIAGTTTTTIGEAVPDPGVLVLMPRVVDAWVQFSTRTGLQGWLPCSFLYDGAAICGRSDDAP